MDGYVLSPRLVGASVGLHPVWIMFALLAFGALFGFTGLIVAVPVAAALGALMRFLARPITRARSTSIPCPIAHDERGRARRTQFLRAAPLGAADGALLRTRGVSARRIEPGGVGDDRTLARLAGPRIVADRAAGRQQGHLCAIWAARAGALVAAPEALPTLEALLAQAPQAVQIDNVDRVADETALFHLLNFINETGAFLLLSAARAPRAGEVRFPTFCCAHFAPRPGR